VLDVGKIVSANETYLIYDCFSRASGTVEPEPEIPQQNENVGVAKERKTISV
jgi:hypothetical protein